jgi:hypothetical protein
MLDFDSLDGLQRLFARFPFPADGVCRRNGEMYEVTVTILAPHPYTPGRPLRGTLPADSATEDWINRHNWRRV